MINLKSDFWSEEYPGNIYLTDEMVRICEGMLQLRLPQMFIELLKIQNGGYTKSLYFNDDIQVEEIFGIYLYEENPTVLDTEYLVQEWDLPQNQLLISGNGHTWISLDYSEGLHPIVKIIDVDENKSTIISKSFKEFVRSLEIKN